MTLDHPPLSALSAEQLSNLTRLSRITSSPIQHIACSSDGTLLAVASPMGVTFYDASLLTPLWNYAVSASFVCFYQNHPISIIASGNEVHVIHAIDKQVFHVLKAEESSISRLAVSQASDLLAVLYGQHTVKIWSLSAMSEHASYTEETGNIHGFAFHPGSQVLALSTREGVRLWDLNEGTSTLWPVEQMRYVKSLFFDPDGMTLLATGQKKTEHDTEEEEDDDDAVWELISWQVRMLDQDSENNKQKVFQLVWGGKLAQLETQPDHTRDPRTKRYELIGSGDGRWLAVVEAPTVSLWSKSETGWEVCRTYDALSFDLLVTYGSHTVVGVAFAARGTHLVVAYDTEGVVVYDAFDTTYFVAEKRLGNHSRATTVAFHPYEDLLAVGDTNGVGQIFRLRDNMRLSEVFPPFMPHGHGSHNMINSLVFHPDGTCITANRSGHSAPDRVFIWRTADGTLLTEVAFERGEELSGPVAFIGNADLLVTTYTSDMYEVTRRRISDGKILQTFPLAVPPLLLSESLQGSWPWKYCQLSPDRTLLLIKHGWHRPSVMYCTLWRMQDGENIGTFEQLQVMDWHATMAISSNNRWLAMTTRTGSIGIWDMESRQLVRLLTPDTRLDGTRRLLFTVDSSLLIVREDYQVSFWRVDDGQRLWTIKTGYDSAALEAVRLAFRNDGRLLALIEDGEVSLWGLHPDVLSLPEALTNSDRSTQTLFGDDQRQTHQQEALRLDIPSPDQTSTNGDRSVQTLPDDSHGQTNQQATPHQRQAVDARSLETLLGALSHPRRSVSVAAAHALGDLGTPQALEALLACLRDRRGAVRAAAARSLRWFHDPRIAEALLICLQDRDAKVRTAAAQNLPRFRDPQIVEALLTCLQDRDAKVRTAAAQSLSMTKEKQVIASLLACLQHPDKQLRRAALNSLGSFSMQEKVEPFIACLQDQYKLIRMDAAEYLGRFADRRAVEPLIACLRDPSYRVRCSAATSLGLLGDARAVPYLLTCLADQDRPLRTAAAASLEAIDDAQVASLEAIGDAQTVDSLLTCLYDSSLLVCEAAVRALKKLVNPEAVDLLNACIGSAGRTNHSHKTIGGAVESIQHLKDRTEAIAFLLACFSVRDKGGYHSVSSAATRSLAELSDSSTVEPLILHLQDQNANVRIRAAFVLGKLGERQATEPLIACLHDPHDNVRYQAARSLGELGDARAIEPLLSCLQDPNSYVRDAAAFALEVLAPGVY